MRRLQLLAVLLVSSFWAVPWAHAGEPGAFLGLDLGVSEPSNGNYQAHVHTGGSANPYVGYMLHDNFGLQLQGHFLFQEPDNDHRGFNFENQHTTLVGGTFGPRIAFPAKMVSPSFLSGIEIYGTGQGGYFSGISGRLTQSAPGFSVGGGVDFYLTDNVAVTGFGRWNRAYMSARPTTFTGSSPGEQGPSDI